MKTSRYIVHNADCRRVLCRLPSNYFHSCVTDPPYGLSKEPDVREVMGHWLNDKEYEHRATGFMGNSWDSFVPGPEYWREVYRVLKPGAHCLVFAGTRTYDLMTVALRFAGFEVRDCIRWMGDTHYPAWTYSSGFPKSMNVANAIHDATVGQPQGGTKPGSRNHGKYKSGCSDANKVGRGFGAGPGQFMRESGAAGERELVGNARPWEGWGTALKPSWEPIVVVRKPLESNVAANVLKHGAGALNIDGCRVPLDGRDANPNRIIRRSEHEENGWGMTTVDKHQSPLLDAKGRFPANIVHDGSERVIAEFPNAVDGSGSVARFFYAAKASKAEKNVAGGNPHPTVKPVALMRYLARLVTPENGRCLDPFMGSGTTGVACLMEGLRFIGVDREPAYYDIALKRLAHAASAPKKLGDLCSR